MERLKSLFFSASERAFPEQLPHPYVPVKMTDSSNGADTVDWRNAYLLVSSSNR